jgi:hypothetical protein
MRSPRSPIVVTSGDSIGRPVAPFDRYLLAPTKTQPSCVRRLKKRLCGAPARIPVFKPNLGAPHGRRWGHRLANDGALLRGELKSAPVGPLWESHALFVLATQLGPER